MLVALFASGVPLMLPGVATPDAVEPSPVPPLLPPAVDELVLQPGPPPFAVTVPNVDGEPALPQPGVPSARPAPPAPMLIAYAVCGVTVKEVLVSMPPAPPPPECRLPPPPPPPTMRNCSAVTDGGDVHVYDVVDVKLRTQSVPTVEAVTPVVEFTVVVHDPDPMVTGTAGAANDA